MSYPIHAADCDLVVELEEAGVGIEEILQYAHGVLSENEIRALIGGLARIVEERAGASDGLSDSLTVARAASASQSQSTFPSPTEPRTV